MDPVITSVFDLSPDEKLQLVQDLWDDIAAEAMTSKASSDVIAEVNRRRENLQQNPQSSRTLSEIESRIRNAPR